MSKIQTDILIIGAGLTGLTLAYLLGDSAFKVKIVEARDRIGGRIHTVQSTNNTTLDMGATWLGSKHQSLIQLLEELQIPVIAQFYGGAAIYEPISTSPWKLVNWSGEMEPTYRMAYGSSSLIDKLSEHIDNQHIHLSTIIKYIEITENGIKAKSDSHTYNAKKIISTLPPYLFTNSIQINQPLPDLLKSTSDLCHTWMGESIKVSLIYKEAFWKKENSSGTIVSNVGPIPEMYDHSPIVEDDQTNIGFALMGFMDGSYYSLTKDERLQKIIVQLSKYYGDQAENYLSYEETVWRNEPFTFTNYKSHILPHQNNGHPILREPIFNNRLILAGSETADQFPGYMDGAVRSARHVFNILTASPIT